MELPKFDDAPRFACQVLFSILLSGFSMYMIISDRSSQTLSIFLPVLTGVTATWLPSPRSTDRVAIAPPPDSPV